MNISFTIENTTIYALNFVFSKIPNAIPVHSHGSNCYEIHYIPSGFGQIIADNIKYDIVPNTLYVTGPHINHAQFPSSDNPMVEYCIYIKTDHTDSLLHNSPILNCFTSTPFWLGSDTQNLSPILAELKNELQSKEIGHQEKIKTLLCQIIIGIVRNYKRENNTSASHTETFFSDNKSLIIEEYFLYEYAHLSLKELSDRLNLSTRQTERILKEYYGKNFQQKKLEAKMSIASILLQEDNSISYIADHLGFSSLEHFSAAFKKYYNISPSRFKKLSAKADDYRLN